MAAKRPRAAYEADLRSIASPHVVYGNPLPPLDSEVRDDGSFVPVWQQEVRDERGRKRLHGAFTGGFSAGYFNTVGSKEGWTPQTFVSSRANRVKASQRAEDFMDDEDVADAEEAQKLRVVSAFSGLGSTADELSRNDLLVDLARPGGETIGVKLLQKMGWRPGQGVGPKLRRKADLGIEEGGDNETHLFAPVNRKMIGFVQKNDFKGLGYAGEATLPSLTAQTLGVRQEEDEDEHPLSQSKTKLVKAQKKTTKSGFGVGILNDTGSDEEDAYHMGPKISYNRTIGGDKKGKRNGIHQASMGSANPLFAAKPVFISKKRMAKKSALGFRKCHDGRLPLDGFILSTTSSGLSPANTYSPLQVPDGWKNAKNVALSRINSNYTSSSDIAKGSKLDPQARAALLGEKPLPGKSVFDFITPAARNRLAASSGRTDLPPALGEAPPDAYKRSDVDTNKYLWSLVPPLDKDLALAALNRGINGWMPYSEDPDKRARYRGFLELSAGLAQALPVRPAATKIDEWKKELNEFAHAAFVFRPATGMMATRFTSSSSTFEGSFNPVKASDGSDGTDGAKSLPLLSTPSSRPEDPAEAAARMGMYGPLTRSVQSFHPTRLVCKRFNVGLPSNVAVDPGNDVTGDGPSSTSVPEIVSKASVAKMLQDAAQNRFASGGVEGGTPESQVPMVQVEHLIKTTVRVDPESNEALEAERPGDAVFKAIFGSDEEDEDE